MNKLLMLCMLIIPIATPAHNVTMAPVTTCYTADWILYSDIYYTTDAVVRQTFIRRDTEYVGVCYIQEYILHKDIYQSGRFFSEEYLLSRTAFPVRYQRRR